MKHSKLVPVGILNNEKLSIIQIAILVIDFYKKLTIIDNNYSQICIVSDHPLHENIDVNALNAYQYLADEILYQNIDNIRKIDKVVNPDTSFSRDTSLTFSIDTTIGENTLITLFYAFGTISSRIASVVVNEQCLNTFEKSKKFIDAIVSSFSVEYAAIRISDRELNKTARMYKAPLGLITYISNNNPIQIPIDFEGIDNEHTKQGRYLILTDVNKIIDKDPCEAYRQKLLTIMDEIKQRVPEYVK